MVNRSTFYRHYLDKYDLLRQYVNDIVANEVTIDEKSGHMSEGAPSGLVRLLKHIQLHGDFYRVMLGPKGDPVFTQQLRRLS